MFWIEQADEGTHIQSISKTLIDALEANRNEEKESRTRKNKVNILPDKGIIYEDWP